MASFARAPSINILIRVFSIIFEQHAILVTSTLKHQLCCDSENPEGHLTVRMTVIPPIIRTKTTTRKPLRPDGNFVFELHVPGFAHTPVPVAPVA